MGTKLYYVCQHHSSGRFVYRELHTPYTYDLPIYTYIHYCAAGTMAIVPIYTPRYVLLYTINRPTTPIRIVCILDIGGGDCSRHVVSAADCR